MTHSSRCIEGAKALKGCKYILTSKKATLRSKDNDNFLGKEISTGSELLKKNCRADWQSAW